MNKIDWIVLGICLLCLYAVLQIRLGCFWYIGSVKNADAINSIIEGLSYSYIAAYLFYILTSYLPERKRKKKLGLVIQDRVHKIGVACINGILFEFARETGLKADYSDTQHTEEILKSKNWDVEVPILKRYKGVSVSYFRYANLQCKDIKERVADIVLRYKEVMTAEELVALENLTKELFISHMESLSSYPNMSVNDGADSLISAFIDLQQKFIAVEKVFKIRT